MTSVGSAEGASSDREAVRTRPPVPLLNIANILTATRIAFVPVFIAIVVLSRLESQTGRLLACLTFCVAAATDYVDGWIARAWGLVTAFGKVADPIADKALVGSALVLLSWYGQIPWWVTVVILVRELAVTALRFWVIKRAVIAASGGGKIKTALQVVGIAWCLAPVPALFHTVGWWIMIAAMVVTVVTGMDYVGRALRVRRTGPARGDGG